MDGALDKYSNKPPKVTGVPPTKDLIKDTDSKMPTIKPKTPKPEPSFSPNERLVWVRVKELPFLSTEVVETVVRLFNPRPLTVVLVLILSDITTYLRHNEPNYSNNKCQS